jgi:hypothetical protein
MSGYKTFFFPLYFSLLGHLSFHLPKHDLPIFLSSGQVQTKEWGARKQMLLHKVSKRKETKGTPPPPYSSFHPTNKRPFQNPLRPKNFFLKNKNKKSYIRKYLY